MTGLVLPFTSLHIRRSKLTHYLLDPGHPDGGPKAVYFLGFGFRRDRPEPLADALLEHARVNPVVRIERTRWGIKIVVDGPLATPDGRDPGVRAVWIGEDGGAAELVTAYPVPGL